MDDRIIELIQRQIDGVNSSDEQRELQKVLATDNNAQTLFDDLKNSVHLLESTESIEPPSDLKHRIMASLPVERYATSKPREAFDWSAVLARLFQVRPRLGYAYTFAVGMLAGLAFMGVLGGASSESHGSVYGTLVSQEAIASLQTAGELRIDLGDVNGHVRVRQGEKETVVEVSVDATSPTQLRLNFDEPSFRFRGFAPTDVDPEAEIRLQHGSVTSESAERHAFVLAFDGPVAQSMLQVEILQDGMPRYQETLKVVHP